MVAVRLDVNNRTDGHTAGNLFPVAVPGDQVVTLEMYRFVVVEAHLRVDSVAGGASDAQCDYDDPEVDDHRAEAAAAFEGVLPEDLNCRTAAELESRRNRTVEEQSQGGDVPACDAYREQRIDAVNAEQEGHEGEEQPRATHPGDVAEQRLLLRLAPGEEWPDAHEKEDDQEDGNAHLIEEGRTDSDLVTGDRLDDE